MKFGPPARGPDGSTSMAWGARHSMSTQIFIAVIWALVASFIIIALPIWESKDQILAVFDGIFHTNLCEYYNPETSKQHKLHTAAAAAEPAKAAEPVS